MSIPDNYSQWEAHEGRQEKWRNKRPKCPQCREAIQDEDCYELDGNVICPNCIGEYIEQHHKQKTEDFIN